MALDYLIIEWTSNGKELNWSCISNHIHKITYNYPKLSDNDKKTFVSSPLQLDLLQPETIFIYFF